MGGINTAEGRSVQVRVICCKGALDASALSLQPKATGTRASRGLCELLLSRWDPHGCKKRQVAVAVPSACRELCRCLPLVPAGWVVAQSWVPARRATAPRGVSRGW